MQNTQWIDCHRTGPRQEGGRGGALVAGGDIGAQQLDHRARVLHRLEVERPQLALRADEGRRLQR